LVVTQVNEWAIVITSGIMVVMTVTLVTLAVYFWRKKSQSEQKYALLVQVRCSTLFRKHHKRPEALCLPQPQPHRT
jgi:ABC-type protease/lipase transport system fused ATPase/permease subunit